jgi:hypothetical protein
LLKQGAYFQVTNISDLRHSAFLKRVGSLPMMTMKYANIPISENTTPAMDIWFHLSCQSHK